ncbi:pyridoxamine 5'-phosphate oxidase family protein [Arthrobacter celericrescens]|uniref:pyridoxamine 5'-phosphate oxidase family protein n=1 Tax=Arthrobacter celericrescens TaxID=2320851 RepID=UPI000EA38116|nr:pyridoxamine 5'-phosphate oxidase family protein [Arthrobacter celericrescens]
MDNPAPVSETVSLTVHDCWKYLETSSVGRVALVRGGDPEIFPVNYVPDFGTLIFRTGPGTKLEALQGGKPVAFEADGLNPYGTIAWSVVVKGTAELVEDPGELREAAATSLSPWEAGTKDQLIRIVPTGLSGRRFVISDPVRWWPPITPDAPSHRSDGGA